MKKGDKKLFDAGGIGDMTDKKETMGLILAVVALISCCLLLLTILAGGTLSFLGSYFKNNWLIILGIIIIIAGFGFTFIRRVRK